MEPGAFVEGKMVALLRALGADYVLDTNFAADLTIVEEASELIRRITEKDRPLPQFTSCCPGLGALCGDLCAGNAAPSVHRQEPHRHAGCHGENLLCPEDGAGSPSRLSM